MMKKIILLVEDNGFVRELVSKAFAENYEVISVTGGKQALENYKICKPDIVLSDIYLEDLDGLSLLELLREINTQIPIILFTTGPNKHFVKLAIQNKATAVLLKQEGFIAELNFVLSSLNHIRECFLGNGISAVIKDDNLTKREIEIVQMIADGKTSEAIAEALFISIHTVNNHRKHIKKKLAYNNLAQLTKKINALFAI